MPRRLDDPDDPPWLEAERRDFFLRGLLRANNWIATREVVESDPTGRGTPGAKRLDIRTERLIGQQIDRFWLKKERPKMSALIRRVHEACRIEGLPPPDRSTIQPRIDELDAPGAARRRGEVSLEAEVVDFH
jgi:putative transposase